MSPGIRGKFRPWGARDGCQLTTRNAVTSPTHTMRSTSCGIYGETYTARFVLTAIVFPQRTGVPPQKPCKPCKPEITPKTGRYVNGWMDGLGEGILGGRRLHSRTAFKAVTGFGTPRRIQE